MGGNGRRHRRRLGGEVCGVRSREPRAGDEGQAQGGDGPELAGEGERSVAPLLLADAADAVIKRVEYGDLSVPLDHEPLGPRKEGVADVVLRPAAGRRAEISRPPLAAEPGAAPCGAGRNIWLLASALKSSLQRLSTVAFSEELNMSPTMVVPPRIH